MAYNSGGGSSSRFHLVGDRIQPNTMPIAKEFKMPHDTIKKAVEKTGYEMDNMEEYYALIEIASNEKLLKTLGPR